MRPSLARSNGARRLSFSLAVFGFICGTAIAGVSAHEIFRQQEQIRNFETLRNELIAARPKPTPTVPIPGSKTVRFTLSDVMTEEDYLSWKGLGHKPPAPSWWLTASLVSPVALALIFWLSIQVPAWVIEGFMLDRKR